MTYRIGGSIFPNAGLALAAAMLALAAGCTSVETVPVAEGRTGGPVDTGTFPNLNVPQQAAAPQLTQAETDAKLAALRAAAARQSPGAGVETAEARRRRLQLTADDQADTLNVIEGN